MRIIPLSSLPETSNNIIQKGLAFAPEQSSTVTVPSTRHASGSCPAGCKAKVGLWWWKRTTPHHRNGGSRWQDLPIRNSSFYPLLRSAMIEELNCRRTSRAKPPKRSSLSSCAPACWRKSQRVARCRLDNFGAKPLRTQQPQQRMVVDALQIEAVSTSNSLLYLDSTK